jgi:hypothetical protein
MFIISYWTNKKLKTMGSHTTFYYMEIIQTEQKITSVGKNMENWNSQTLMAGM